jgi:hypothetical protein
MKERNLLEERKKEEKSEKLKDINNKRKEELLKNKIKDLPKNKERKRNNKISHLILISLCIYLYTKQILY